MRYQWKVLLIKNFECTDLEERRKEPQKLSFKPSRVGSWYVCHSLVHGFHLKYLVHLYYVFHYVCHSLVYGEMILIPTKIIVS